MNWLGLDIGGANLKAADGHGWARSVPFPLWREPGRLPAALRAVVEQAPSCNAIAITMTGELCDCFRTKNEGVSHILDAVEEAAGRRQLFVYLVDGRMVSLDAARRLPQLAAASNWHILASFAARLVQGETGMLIDIGSTTADLVPIVGGRPYAQGLNDTDRLLAGELVYSGVGRTPICALTDSLPWRGRRCPVASELFATTADAYVLLGDLPEQPEFTLTADGRPLTREFSCDRLARMVCSDRTACSDEDARVAAGRVRDAQLDRLRRAIQTASAAMPARPDTLILSGVGEFLAARLAAETFPLAVAVSLSKHIGTEASRCGPAHALAVLARESGQDISLESSPKGLTGQRRSAKMGGG